MTSYKGYEKESDMHDKKSYGLFHPQHLSELNNHIKFWLKGKLWLQILIGMVLGVITGFILNPSRGMFNEQQAFIIGEWLAIPGDLFITLIQMIVIPLIMVSIMRAIASNKNIKQVKKRGWVLIIYLLIVSGIAVAIGIGVGNLIKPGSYIDSDLLSGNETSEIDVVDNTDPLTLKTIPRKVVDLFPGNPLNAMLENQMLQIVILSFIFGFALLSLSRKAARPLMDLLSAVQSVTMVIVKWVMFIAPLAVFGLLAQLMIKTGLDVLFGLGVYVLTVLFGLFILMLFFMGIVFFIGGKNPFKFIASSKEALLLAFSTDSSAVVMPLSIRTAEEKMDIKPNIAQFVIPIGATINMSGTALYQGLATMFMAQLFGITLPISILLALIITAVGASIGTPATPGVGIIVLSSVLTSAGIPLVGIPLILGVDRILEMSRAVLNVAGDLVACIVVQRFSK